MSIFAGAFGLVFVAEAGDKSMLLALTLAVRYRWWVLVAIALETAVAMGLAVVAGGVAEAVLPERAVGSGAAVLFIAFGVWTLLAREGADEAIETKSDRPLVLVIGGLAVAMFLAELGDKTQLAALSLAGLHADETVLVWLGASAGMIAADAVAIFVGIRLGRALPQRMIAIVAGLAFIAFGLVTLVVTFG